MATRSLHVLTLLLLACAAARPLLAQPAAPSRPAESIEDYESRALRGFRVMVNRSLLEDRALLHDTLAGLDHDLSMVERSIARPQLEFLRSVTVWVETQGAVVPGGMSGRGMCYHPSARWLAAHGLLREKAGGIEVVNARDFLEWRRNQPFMTLHELAHAYHHALGYEHPGVRAAYDAAMAEGLYEAVAYNLAADGAPVRAYAANNPQEYFAELTEAYFGLNDYFPFTRPQLRHHDPRGFELIERLWTMNRDELADAVAANAERQ
ncbi:MAG: hypothetical protein KJZ54_13390 [Phycisphaerales bacterium]|nr:hypothetical protein [Phycisphaerales bacterium]